MNDQALAHIDHLNADWLSVALGHQVKHFRSDDLAGEGYNSRLYRIHIDYTEPDTGAPETLILKLMAENPIVGEIMTNNEEFREVHSYRYLGEDLHAVVPTAYVTAVDKEQGHLTLLLEDLGAIPHKPFRADLTTSLAAVRAIAKVHAKFWESELTLAPELQPNAFDMKEVARAITESLELSSQREVVHPYLDACMRHVRKLAPIMIELTQDFDGRPSTLIHGDFHCRNIHRIDDRVMIFDWQNSQRGSAATDLAYWMITSVDHEDRPGFETELLDAYYESLTEAGVDGYTRRQLQNDYQEMAGLMVTQIYCYQAVLDMSTEEQQQEVADFLARSNAIAEELKMLNRMRIAWLIVPPLVLIRRLRRLFAGNRDPSK